MVQSHGDSGIYQFDLADPIPLAPVLLFDSSGTPLLTQTKRMSVYDIPSAGGRTYILSAPQGDFTPFDAVWVVLRDPNNDGVVDQLLSLTHAQWQADPISDRTAWRDLSVADGYVFEW